MNNDIVKTTRKRIKMKNKKITLQFKGIDDWNRPVFKRQDTNSFYGDTCNLFSYSATAEDVLTWYKQNPNKLCNIEYFWQAFLDVSQRAEACHVIR